MSFGIDFNTAQGILRKMKKRSVIVPKISEGKRYYSYRSPPINSGRGIAGVYES